MDTATSAYAGASCTCTVYLHSDTALSTVTVGIRSVYNATRRRELLGLSGSGGAHAHGAELLLASLRPRP